MEAEIEALKAKLAQAEADNAALQADVEMLCLQTTSNPTFNTSSVLQEHRELKESRQKVAALQAEKQELGRELAASRAAERRTAAALAEARQGVEAGERELSFYQTASARAVADRDRLAYEAQALRDRAMSLETRCSRAEDAAAMERGLRAAAEQRVEGLRGEVAALETRAAAAARVPELEAELAEAGRGAARAAGQLRAAEKTAAELRAVLSAREEEVRGLKESAAVVAAEREADAARTAQLERAHAELAGELEVSATREAGLTEQLVQARRATSAVEEELVRAGEAHEETRGMLREVAAQKVEALQRQSQAEDQVFRLEEVARQLRAELAAAQATGSNPGSAKPSPTKGSGTSGAPSKR